MTITKHETATDLGEQIRFAQAVVARPEGAAASLLPQAYRDNPGNVLLAVGLGSSMGLSPAESLYRIDVIQGKPTASAELIASNVRKAGHKLRVETDEHAMRVTATIIRADDPDFPHVVTRDMEWAKAMGLTSKDNYKKQPLTMLEWRAISACARKACSEALYGVAYTSDEMYDDGGVRPGRVGLGDVLDRPVGPGFVVEQVPNEPILDLPDDEADDRLPKMLAAYARAGVTQAMLEAHQSRPADGWDDVNLAALTDLFEALKSGKTRKEDEFPELAGGVS